MSKFVIECPVCHNYTEASTGFSQAETSNVPVEMSST